jgi:hypothetical protein
MGDVEHANRFPHGGVLSDDAGVVNGHLPAAERSEGGAGLDVEGV